MIETAESRRKAEFERLEQAARIREKLAGIKPKPKEVEAGKFDRVGYMRRYMRLRRAAAHRA